MPKEILELNRFVTGTISTPSDTDVPDDAATFSINVDPVAEDGKLMGVEQDLIFDTVEGFIELDSASQESLNIKSMAMINGRDTDDLIIYRDESTSTEPHGKVQYITDIGGIATVGTHDETLPSSERAALTPNNKEVHIGLGNSPDNPPYWAGYIAHSGIGRVSESNLVVEEAELRTQPSAIENNVHKLVRIGGDVDRVFAIEWRGSRIYTRGMSDTGSIIDDSATWEYWSGFEDLRGMFTYDGKLFVLEGSGTGSIINVDLDTPPNQTHVKVSTYTFASDGGYPHTPQSCLLSDINYCVNGSGAITIWIAAYREGAGEDAKVYSGDLSQFVGLLWRSESIASGNINSDNTSLAFTNATPTLLSNGTGKNNWGFFVVIQNVQSYVPPVYDYSYDHSSFFLEVTFQNYYKKTYRHSLVQLDGNTQDGIGWVSEYPDFGLHSTSAFVAKWGPVKFHRSRDGLEGDDISSAYHGVSFGGDESNELTDFSLEGTVLTTVKTDATHTSDGVGYLISRSNNFNCAFYENAADLGLAPDNSVLYTGTANSLNCYKGQIPLIETSGDFVKTVGTSDAVEQYGSDIYGNVPENVATMSGFSDNIYPQAICSQGTAGQNIIISTCSTGGSVRIDRWNGYRGDNSQLGNHRSRESMDELFLLSAIVKDDSTGGFTAANKYYYAFSLTYDGYQESPLSDKNILDDDGTTVEVTIKIKDTTKVSKRISHVNIYRAESPDALDEAEGFYRLIKTFDIGDFPEINNHPLTYVDIYTKIGASYEARTGMSEVIGATLPHYGLAKPLNGYLFIADCWHRFLDDASNYIFRSQIGKYDIFNWVEDFLILPSAPTALASFQGRLYAFDKNNTYRIDPNNLVIEDTFEGVGCAGPKAVVVTEYGMCFADDNNIYLHNGSRPVPIGEPILKGEISHNFHKDRSSAQSHLNSWQGGRDKSWKPIVTFDKNRNSFCVFFKNKDSSYGVPSDSYGNQIEDAWNCWAFNIARKRWDLWEYSHYHKEMGFKPENITNGEIVDAITGPDGNILVASFLLDSDGNKMGRLIKYHAHPDKYRPWSWYSKRFTMGAPTQVKKLKNVKYLTSHTLSDVSHNIMLDNQYIGYNEEFKELDDGNPDNDYYIGGDNSPTNIMLVEPASLPSSDGSQRKKLTAFNEMRLKLFQVGWKDVNDVKHGHVETVQESTNSLPEQTFNVPKAVDSIGIVYKRKPIR